MKRYLTLLLLFLTASLPALAQRQTDNWYFGQNASLEFNAAGVPVSFANSAMDAPWGSASISDKHGNLLFYTDGETVWNRLHQVMANGSGLAGRKLASQSAIIVPQPGSDSLFYIFTHEPNVLGSTGTHLTKLAYSVVDISAQNGLGEIVSGFKNTILYTAPAGQFLSEKLTAVHHANNSDVWLITHRFPGLQAHEFLVYKITASGIQASPVISNLTGTNTALTAHGIMKAAPTGQWVAGQFHGDKVLLKFNNATGTLSDPITLNPNGGSIGQVEFSPDGMKLYAVMNVASIFQFDLSSGNPATIINSQVHVAQAGQSNIYTGLQLASNGKIYAGQSGLRTIGEIVYPNVAGSGSTYRTRVVLAQGTNMRGSFPNFIQSYFAPPRFNYTGFCAGSPVSFTITNQAGIDSVVWNFDDPASGSRNQSKQLQPSHSFTAPGMFMVTLKIYSQGFESIHERLVEIKSTPQVDIGRDTTLCDGQTIQLRNKFPLSPFNERFLWSTGDTTATLTAGAPGIYWLELNNGTCTFRDSMEIKINPQPKVDLGGNKSFCGNQPYTLNATVNLPGATYFWSPGGETTPTLTVTKSGEYEVLVDVNGCQATDKAQITFRTILNFELGPDITVCEGEIVTLRTVGPTPTTFYTWSDGTRHTSVLNPTQSGTYWVEIKRDGCTVTDTVNVTFLPCPPPPVPLIPNIITPNGDGLNDLFVLKEIPEGAWNLKLFNRWGIEIFNRKGYRNTWPETEINDGTYYYFLEDPDTGRTWKGWLEVVR